MPDSRFLERLATIDAYGVDWWRSDESALEACAVEPERGTRALALSDAHRVVETAVFHETNGDWTERRRPVHTDIVDALNGLLLVDGKPEKPVLAVTMGLPGSGKSTVLRPMVAQAIGASASVIDADEVRVRLPEYAAGLGSHVVQLETVYLTYGEVYHRAIESGSHVVIDVLGKLDHLRQYRSVFPNHELHVLLSDVPVEVAVERAEKRCLSDGRYVPEQVIRAAAARPRLTFDEALKEGLAKEWALVDNAGDNPVLVTASDRYDTISPTG